MKIACSIDDLENLSFIINNIHNIKLYIWNEKNEKRKNE